MSRLTPKRQLFVENYCQHYNAVRAVKEAYGQNPYPRGTERWKRFEASARARGSELLTIPNVSEAIAVRQRRIRQKFDFDEDMVVAELASIVFTHLSDVAPWDKDGAVLIPSEELPRLRTGAVKRLKFRRTTEVDDSEKDEEGNAKERVVKIDDVEITLHDRVPAIKLLLQHGGWLARAVKVNALPGSEVNVDARTLNLSALEKLTADELVELARQMPEERE